MHKILHFIRHFSVPSETFIYNLVHATNDLGNFKAQVLCYQRYLKSERPSNITDKIDSFGYLDRLLLKFRITEHPKLLMSKTKKYIRNNDFDIIHSHFGPNGLFMQHILNDMRLPNLPHVISFHGMDINTLPYEKENYLNQLLNLNNCNTVYTSPSLFLKRKMISLGLDGDRIKVIPNSVADIFLDLNSNSAFNPNKLRLISVGRLEKVKGHLYTIQALHQLIQYLPNIHLTIVGYGKEERNLKNTIEKLELNDHVYLLGRTEHKDIPYLLSKSDIYIHSSIRTVDKQEESFGLAVLEALAVGLPVVSTNTGGTKEIIRRTKGGLLIEPGKPELIAEAILKIADNLKLYRKLKSNAKQGAKTYYSTNIILNKWNSLYYELV